MWDSYNLIYMHIFKKSFCFYVEINWQHCESELDPESGETGVRNQDQIDLNSLLQICISAQNFFGTFSPIILN